MRVGLSIKFTLCYYQTATPHLLRVIRGTRSNTLATKKVVRGSSVGKARDSGCGGRGFDPRCGRPLPIDWVGISIM